MLVTPQIALKVAFRENWNYEQLKEFCTKYNCLVPTLQDFQLFIILENK